MSIDLKKVADQRFEYAKQISAIGRPVVSDLENRLGWIEACLQQAAVCYLALRKRNLPHETVSPLVMELVENAKAMFEATCQESTDRN